MIEPRQEANTASSKAFWKRQEAGQVYDRQFQNTVGSYIDSSEMEPVLDLLSGLQGGHILDVGCGTGRFLPWLTERNRVTGMDLSESMLEQARAKCAQATLTAASVLAIPFPDNTFDAVYSVRVIQHIRDQEQMIREMSRVCKPGGRVVLVTYNSWSLLSLYKHIRMSWAGRVLNFPIGWLLKQRSFFGPWGFEYDNYLSIPEARAMMRRSGIRVDTSWGTATGMPWFLQSFFVGKILEKTLPFLLRFHLKVCRFLDKTVARPWPLKYFNDLVVVSGIKQP